MKTILTCFVCLMALGHLQSQEIVLQSISSAGKDHRSNDVSLGWNLGESCINTWTQTNTILSEGFYQDFDLLLPVEKPFNLFKVEVFPNPLTKNVQIQFPANMDGPIHYRILDINGRKHLEDQLSSSECRIDCSSLKEGSYLLSLYAQDGRLLSLHKIIKTKK